MKNSAGILLYRHAGADIEVFLVHPGGPFWQKKDTGAWTIPKGEFQIGEDPLGCAIREFAEETGALLSGHFRSLGSVQQKVGKKIHAWCLEGNLEAELIVSNTFEMEWPPRSGKRQSFPEVDRGKWFSLSAARLKINPAQEALLEELILQLSGS
ncbi:MAG: NUDIX domain-containing protein [Chitinophagaceae bacterium]